MNLSALKDRLRWLNSRLKTMGPAEVGARFLEAGQYALLLPRLHRLEQLAAQRPAAERTVPELNGCLRHVDFGMQDRVLSLAAPWLNHRATLFQQVDFRLGETINWHRDYLTGVEAPRRYSPLIDHRDLEKTGNVKYVWELNRLQHLVPLLLASKWTEREAYREEVQAQIESWCRENPFMHGLNWKSPLEAGLRLITWSVLSLLQPGIVLDPAVRAELLKSIFLHQYFIRRFHSRHSSANNHLIGEMAGLYVASTLWPRTESREWRAYARKALLHELLRQTEADGVGQERAIEYQLFVAEFFILAGALGHASHDPFPEEYWQRISRMLAFLQAIADCRGNFPMFGDGDNGQVISLGDTRQERAASLTRLVAPQTGSACPADLRTALLLWGQEPTTIPFAAALSGWTGIQAFPAGGYYVLSTERGSEDEMLVVFDVAPFGLPPLYAHAHADALSFWLSYGGKEFLIDPGTYCYDSSRWRTYFRSTAAHNTIRVDGQEQAVPAGPFLWHSIVNARLEALEDGEACAEVEGCHDGYGRLDDPVVHHRRLRLFRRSRTLAIIDRLECEGQHEVEIFFHFSENCRVAQVKPNGFLVTNGDRSLLVQLDSRFTVSVEHGSDSPISGWVSRSFGFKQPSVSLVGRAVITGSVPFFSEIGAA